MSARLARLVVYVGAAVLPDSATRVRYREQWLADVDGAAEVGLSPLSVALGAAAAAVRLAATHPRSVAALIRVAVLPGVSMRVRRTLVDARGLAQQHRRRRGLGDKRERAVLVDRDLGRDDGPAL